MRDTHNTLGAGIFGVVGIVVMLLTGCEGPPQWPQMYGGDWEPMVLERVLVTQTHRVSFAFNKPVYVNTARLDPPVTVVDSYWEDGMLHVETEELLEAGEEYWMDAILRDDTGNLASMLVNFYGLNENMPEVLINEFVARGSGRNADFVELRIMTAGNLGGITVYNGSPSNWTSRIVLPIEDVEAGDFVVIHFREGRDDINGVLNFPVPDGTGLPTTSGGITVTAFPDGPLLNAVLWSDRTYDPTSDRRGFGTAAQLRIFEEVVALGGWTIRGDYVVPDDGIDPDGHTATRSINRYNDGRNTNSREDWYIVNTGRASPGRPNSEELYVFP